MKKLICINTCNRLEHIKAYAYDFIKFCQNNDGYDFVVSLDGEDSDTINFCNKYHIPLVYSQRREGVGISKNRVLKKFNGYDYYFFIEDDVELINGEIFEKYIKVADRCGFLHMSLDDKWRFFGNEALDNCGDERVIYYNYGSAGFNFFTREGIEKVGGFHTEFAKYKRFGHTEHTYRFVNVGLHERAFITLESCFEGYCNWHNPPSVTTPGGFKTTKNWIMEDEQGIIDKKLRYFPVKTLSKYYYNNFIISDVIDNELLDISIYNKKTLLKKIQNHELQNSKYFLIKGLLERSLKNPIKWVTFPFNVFRILCKK
jgi:hypothetical protein